MELAQGGVVSCIWGSKAAYLFDLLSLFEKSLVLFRSLSKDNPQQTQWLLSQLKTLQMASTESMAMQEAWLPGARDVPRASCVRMKTCASIRS